MNEHTHSQHDNQKHSHGYEDSHYDWKWPPECIRCGVGPSGSDCALLNGFCEHFDPDGTEFVAWMEKANPGFTERVIVGEVTHVDPEFQKRLVTKLQSSCQTTIGEEK